MSRILIVEDDQLQGQLLLEILVSFGNTPTLVETISDALRLFNEQKFDIVVTDYHLGGADASLHANGADLIAYIRSEDKSACDHCVNSSAIPVIAISGYGCREYDDSLHLDRCREMGADVLLSKPVPVHDIKAAIASVQDRIV